MGSRRSSGEQLGAALALLLPFATGAVLVGVRGVVGAPVIALAMAGTVVLGASIGGRAGGVGAAMVAAVTFDFFHTEPYLSLKITGADDVLTTVLLLAVGLAVGASAGRFADLREQTQRRFRAASAVTRVLAVAHENPLDDVESAIRAELIELLHLRDCWVTTTPVELPVLRPLDGWLPGSVVGEEGCTLPPDGVVIPIVAHGEVAGWIVCDPQPGAGIPVAHRRIACSLGEILGLARQPRSAA